LRVDKLTYAALEATLIEYLAGRALQTVPVARMLSMSVDEIASRATVLATSLAVAGWNTHVVDGFSAIGGGSAPGVELPTRLIALSRDNMGAAAIEAMLRRKQPPVIGRIVDDRVMLDLRTVPPDADETLAALLREGA
jgi:L-seryl-tRNA(Ser) seleniumtransferase